MSVLHIVYLQNIQSNSKVTLFVFDKVAFINTSSRNTSIHFICGTSSGARLHPKSIIACGALTTQSPLFIASVKSGTDLKGILITSTGSGLSNGCTMQIPVFYRYLDIGKRAQNKSNNRGKSEARSKYEIRLLMVKRTPTLNKCIQEVLNSGTRSTTPCYPCI
ncbi:unnamed protein product [Leptosia nina]|uniref:Ribosomal protein S11 n=1 Tax=Leptosia nina TaxID=320188 RepID=A0AAV1J6I3_9NEOP